MVGGSNQTTGETQWRQCLWIASTGSFRRGFSVKMSKWYRKHSTTDICVVKNKHVWIDGKNSHLWTHRHYTLCHPSRLTNAMMRKLWLSQHYRPKNRVHIFSQIPWGHSASSLAIHDAMLEADFRAQGRPSSTRGVVRTDSWLVGLLVVKPVLCWILDIRLHQVHHGTPWYTNTPLRRDPNQPLWKTHGKL